MSVGYFTKSSIQFPRHYTYADVYIALKQISI